ncbi:uncharacterized protein LOC142631608 [Castanea sativa]|uniref:uncharacterized protein LOC142631608 n=1 Tax=Castanea sativa TaxID=21020 RepID=UPI003F64B82E
MGRNPSYAWRSLMAAQSIVQRDMRWQEGNDNKIRVWHDKWIPRPCTYKVISTEKPNSTNNLVCELINRGISEWNIDKLNSWLLLEDRDAILGIPLSSSSTHDRLIWAENRSGKFTIKSAYALALEEKTHNTRANCSDESIRRKIWKTIWQLKIPQKIKHFAWKASRDILATKSNLAKWRIIPNGMCNLCGHNEETVCHLLWSFDHAKEVWKNSKFALPFQISTQWNFLDVVVKLQKCDQPRPGQMEKFISVCWGIWEDRNDLRMGGKGKTGRTILRNAMHLVEEFWLANEEKTKYQAELVPLVSWQPPSQGKQAGAGVIIRDGAGEVIAALSKKWKCPLGAIEAEAKALEAKVNFARDVGIRETEFESDSLLICNALQTIAAFPLATHSQETVVPKEQVSSSNTLDEEINNFQLENVQRPRGSSFVVLSDEEEEAAETSGIAGLVVARPDDSSIEEDMDVLKDLLTARGEKVAKKGTRASQAPPALPPPPPPADPKPPADDPKKKRKVEAEGPVARSQRS